MDFQSQLLEVIGKARNAPFLFVGSGFARRHLNTDTWSAMLARFSSFDKPFEYYSSKADGSLPKAAGLLAADFHSHWWEDGKFASKRLEKKSSIRDVSDPLKLEIAEHFERVSPSNLNGILLAEEVVELQKTIIDGVITTNWDKLLEVIFPDYKPYVGQGEILRSSPSGIAEIFKIHGCCSNHRSLVLTDADYEEFTKRNHYLAAKLVTIFIEHPVLFLGYSLDDADIQEMLSNIVGCLGKDHIGMLQDRLIFVSYEADVQVPKMGQSLFRTADATIPLTTITTSSYLPIYAALQQVQRKIPTRVLRHLKEQVVELASTSPQGKQVAVIDITDETNLSSVEFVVGVGVAAKVMGDKGYGQIEAIDLFEDYLFSNEKLHPDRVLKITLPRLLKASPYLPVFHYLKRAGVTEANQYSSSQLQLDKAVKLTPELLAKSVYSHRKDKLKGKRFEEVVASFKESEVLQYIPLLDRDAINSDVLKGYLKDHFDLKKSNQTAFRKAICVLDRIENAWPDVSSVKLSAPVGSSGVDS